MLEDPCLWARASLYLTFTSSPGTTFVHQAVPAIGRLGVVVNAISPGEVELRVPIEGNANHMGTMYAGALFAIAELPGGLIPLAGRADAEGQAGFTLDLRGEDAHGRTVVTSRAHLATDGPEHGPAPVARLSSSVTIHQVRESNDRPVTFRGGAASW